MINKKNLLGKQPDELGIKDAIHTAIVSVRAGCALRPGQRCIMNEYGEAVPDEKGVGVADPFWKGRVIQRGKPFWLLLSQTEIPNVQHVWDHPTVDFSAPKREVELNETIAYFAEQFDITYDQLMDALEYAVKKERPAPYPGKKSVEEIEEIEEDISDLWDEWASETMHEFYNSGEECCPEYDYPECIFKKDIEDDKI